MENLPSQEISVPDKIEVKTQEPLKDKPKLDSWKNIVAVSFLFFVFIGAAGQINKSLAEIFSGIFLLFLVVVLIYKISIKTFSSNQEEVINEGGVFSKLDNLKNISIGTFLYLLIIGLAGKYNHSIQTNLSYLFMLFWGVYIIMKMDKKYLFLHKPKDPIAFVVLLCSGMFLIWGFISIHAFFTDDPASNAPILTREQCGGAEYIARKWCVSNWMQACGPTRVVIHKVNKSVKEKLFGDEFILLDKNVSSLENREHIFDSHWINSELQPKILWDDGKGTSTNNFYFRSKGRSFTSSEIRCLQTVMPNIRNKVHSDPDLSVSKSFNGDVGLAWEMNDGYFGFLAFAPSSGRKEIFISNEDGRVKATGPVIESFSFDSRRGLSMHVPFYSKPEEKISSIGTDFTFMLNLDTKSIAVPESIAYLQKIEVYRDGKFTTESIKELSITYDEIVGALNEAKLQDGKNISNFFKVEKVPSIIFATTTERGEGYVIEKPLF